MVRWLSPVAVALLGCGTPNTGSGGMTITEARAPAPADTAVAAVYFTLINGGTADTLVDVAAGIAWRATVHRSERSSGMQQMQRLSELVILAGETVRLAPGGLHVMLEDLARRPLPGDTIRLTLTFRRAGAVHVSVPVVRYEDLAA